MSAIATGTVWTINGLGIAEKLVLLAFAEQADNEGFTRLCPTRTAQICGMNDEHFLSTCRELHQRGFIVWHAEEREWQMCFFPKKGGRG